MGVRKSDIMAFTAIQAGAGAGDGLTNLYAHGQRGAWQDEMITIVDSSEPHGVHRMRMHRPDHDRVRIMEIRREARGQVREVRERARAIRTEVRVGKVFALQEALAGYEALESLETLKSLQALESLAGIDMEALEQAMEELDFDFEFEFDGEMAVDVQVDDVDDQHKKRKKRKRRIIVKRLGNDGSGN